jgi:hypothetical protein
MNSTGEVDSFTDARPVFLVVLMEFGNVARAGRPWKHVPDARATIKPHHYSLVACLTQTRPKV